MRDEAAHHGLTARRGRDAAAPAAPRRATEKRARRGAMTTARSVAKGRATRGQQLRRRLSWTAAATPDQPATTPGQDRAPPRPESCPAVAVADHYRDLALPVRSAILPHTALHNGGRRSDFRQHAQSAILPRTVLFCATGEPGALPPHPRQGGAPPMHPHAGQRRAEQRSKFRRPTSARRCPQPKAKAKLERVRRGRRRRRILPHHATGRKPTSSQPGSNRRTRRGTP